jgi:hypothetical protein
MARVPDNIINAYKTGVDFASYLNQGDTTIVSNLDLQNKCLFDILIYPENLLSLSPTGIAMAALDTFIMRFHLYAINDIPLVGFEYQRSGGFQFLKDTVYPDSFSCTFLETNFGATKGYFRKWQEQIATYDQTTRDYFFNDNQIESKRSAIIIPQAPDILPAWEWIKIDGMKFKNLTGVGYDHASSEQELLTAEFTCDNIRISLGPTAL